MAKIEITKEVSEQALKQMANDEFKSGFTNLLRSRYPLFYITTNEEPRLITFLDHYRRANGYDCFIWDSYSGLVNLENSEEVTTSEDLKNAPLAILDHIISEAQSYEKKKTAVNEKRGVGCNGIIFVLLDYFRFIEESPDIERRFKAISRLNSIVCAICVGPYYRSTDVLQNIMPVIDFPYPNKQEIRTSLYHVVHGTEKKIPSIIKKTKKMEEELINAVSGLSLSEAQTAFSISLVSNHDWDISLILKEKKQLISKSGMLDYFDKPVSMDNVGGLDNLVNWIKERKKCFSHEAEEYGLKKPRGLLTIGMPGCGKSLVCKAISSVWGMPLLRLDFGRLFGSLVGDSEKNAREAIKLAEAVAPSILWIDEIEKAISGISSSGRSDGGTTSRVLSTFLTWMQEKTSSVFVVATANDHQAIPPEFLRAGRFDEIFFVDLPNKDEREKIFEILLKISKVNPKNINISRLADKSKDYSGAEIEKGIDNAMLVGFTDNKRAITTDDIVTALGEFKSLFQMREADFEELRLWAKTHCRKANFEAVNTVDYNSNGVKDLNL